MSTHTNSPSSSAAGGGGSGEVEQVLYRIAALYFDGCRTYHYASPGSPERVFWRIRLGVLAEVGDQLAAALGQAPPDWAGMNDLAHPSSPQDPEESR